MARSVRTRKSKLLTPTEAADRLLVSPVTLRLWASRGLLPAVTTPGGHRRFREEEIDSFLARRENLRRSKSGGPPRVLIIDDDGPFARSLAELIRKRSPDTTVEIALDGFAAGVKCAAMRPDVVTLDLHMPGMDGFDVCRLLRSMQTRRPMRIVALTGFATRENVARVLASGADACVSKNIPAARLIRELGLEAAVERAPRARGRMRCTSPA